MRRGFPILGIALVLSLPLLVIDRPARAAGAGPRPPTAGGQSPRAGPLRFGEVELATGPRLFYAEGGGTVGEPVLFLHGYSGSWFSWAPVLERLPESIHGFAPSQRGHGDSGRPDCCYAVADFVADAVAFLDAVGIERVTVVGHSIGGFVAQRLAIEHPDRVRKLVLVGASTRAASEVVLELAGRVQGLEEPVPEAFVRQVLGVMLHGSVPAEFLEGAVAEGRRVPARVWRQVIRGMLTADTRTDLSRVRAPTLILWGDRDAVFPRAEQERLWALIPQATLRLYSETGHGLHWERPGPFVKHLAQFLE